MRALQRTAAVAAAAIIASAVVGVVGPPGASGAGPVAFTILASRGDDGPECRLSRVDLTTGVVTPLLAAATTAACVQGLTVGPDGSVYGLFEPSAVRGSGQDPQGEALVGPRVSLVHFAADSGAIVSSGLITGAFDHSTLNEAVGLAFDASGELFVEMQTNEEPECGVACLYRVDPESYEAVLAGPAAPGVIPLGTPKAVPAATPEDFVAPTFLAIACDDSAVSGVTVFDGAEATDDSIGALLHFPQSLAAVNLVSGAFTVGPPLALPQPGAATVGLDYDRATGTLYALYDVQQARGDVAVAAPRLGVGTVNLATGVVSQVVAAVADPDTELLGLAIVGSCPPTGGPIEPIVLEPTFTG